MDGVTWVSMAIVVETSDFVEDVKSSAGVEDC